MDVVHQEQIHFAKFGAKFRHLIAADAIDHLICKSFAGSVIDAAIAPFVHHEIAHGLHQMRLAHPAFAIDKEGIIGVTRALRHCFGGGIGKVVVAPHHEFLEVVAFVQLGVQVYLVAFFGGDAAFAPLFAGAVRVGNELDVVFPAV